MCSELKEEGKPDHTSYGMGERRRVCVLSTPDHS
eukprot:COSAG06_NODE_1409_length_9548_cov_10.589692_13_plen_34_part_00